MQNANKLEYKNADLYIFEKSYHRKYFSGFSSSFGYLLISCEKKIYITDSRYQKAAKDFFAGSDIALEINPNLSEVLNKYKDLFKNQNIKTIGFEGEITVDTFEKIKSAFSEIGQFEFCNISSEVSKIRSVKTQEEIEKITHSMQVSATAYNAFLKTVKVGQTERELCANLNHQLFLHGGDNLAFETIVASGKNGAKPHATPSDKKVEIGDFVTCDFGVCIDGYNSDITRTFAIGEVSSKQLLVYNTVKKAQQAGLDSITSGKNASDIHNISASVIKKAGFFEYFTHGLGHGVGVEIHESPTLNPRSQEILQENMVVTVEPGIYIENEFGVRIEDTIVVKSDGICNLNPLSKELIIIHPKNT